MMNADGAEQVTILCAELRRIRESRGLSQTNLGRRLGMTQTAISKIERGRVKSWPALVAYADTLGCTLTFSIYIPPSVWEA
jgi:transcriptional regulator with XRE-family HTH domain